MCKIGNMSSKKREICKTDISKDNGQRQADLKGYTEKTSNDINAKYGR